MDALAAKNQLIAIGGRLRTARKEQGLTQQELAGPEFTKGYVSALERGSVRPSLKALQVFSRRLGIPIYDFLLDDPATNSPADLAALEGNLTLDLNYARMLIHAGQYNPAMDLLHKIQENAQSSMDKLAPRVRYRIPYLRGLCFFHQADFISARQELEKALDLAKSDPEATVVARNLLGIIFSRQEQPQLALEQHTQCLNAVDSGAVRDLSLRLRVYHNLADDYRALNKLPEATGTYKKALAILKDLGDLDNQADIFWDTAAAYETDGDWSQARIYATRALYVEEAAGNRAAAASISMSLAELMTKEKKYTESENLLNRARIFIAGAGDGVLHSELHQHLAKLAREQGNLDQAAQSAAESLRLSIAASEGKTASKRPHNRARASIARAHSLQTSALIAESQGNTEQADKLFRDALQWIEKSGSEEAISALNFSYAETLAARGTFEKAIEFFRTAALRRPRLDSLDN